jgi:cyclic pyranopterin phosphate synthase
LKLVRDRMDRPLRDLRISVTDRCNLRCPYCMPREVYGPDHVFLAGDELLSFEEITRLVRVTCSLGASKVRLTGGEPLLRPDLERLVRMLADLDGVEDLAITTNGTLLARKARALRQAGLDRITVSLDALEEEAFREMSGTRLTPARIIAGIDAAVDAGFRPVKINMVVRRGVNEHCVIAMAERFRHGPQVLRFIEYMDVGSTNGWRHQEVVPASEILDTIAARWPVEPLPAAREGEVATRFRYRDGGGEIGFIHSVSEPFCGGCTRARLSADGQLYTCLFSTRGHDLRAALRSGADEEELRRLVRGIWSRRSDRYSEERAGAPAGRPRPAKVEMSYIGG